MAYRIQPSTDTLRLSFSHPAAVTADAICRYRREATGSLIFAMAVRCRGHAPGEFIIIFTCGACQCTVTTCNYRAPSRRRRWRWQRDKSPSTAAAFLCIVWVSVWWMHINTYIPLTMHECLFQCTCIWLIYLSGPGSIGFISALAAANTIDNSLETGIPHLDYAPSLVPCPFPVSSVFSWTRSRISQMELQSIAL